MTEQEIKETVELIVKLEKQGDELMERENFSEASACFEAAYLLETELEQQGYFLGESGADMLVYRASPLRPRWRSGFSILSRWADMLVYRASPLRFARDTWLIFNRSNRQWRYSSEASS